MNVRQDAPPSEATTGSATIAGSTGSSTEKDRQRSLDGLRAIAVAAVVYFHFCATSSRALGSGGFLGVDVFFVLSGYLITRLLISEHSTSSRVDLKRFWTRRFRRLFPAFVVFLVLIALYVAISPDFERYGVRADTLWSLFYLQNWHSASMPTAAVTPVAHTWSLSVEEQWYLIWPATLWAILSWAKGRARLVLIVMISVAGASAIWTSILYDGAGWWRAYNGTDARAQELLVGSALAVVLSTFEPFRATWSKWVLEVVGWCAAIFILSEMVWSHASDHFFYSGGFALISVAVVCVIAASMHSTGPLGKSLSWRPLVLLGVISYGVYLFHFPVMFLIEPGRWGLEGSWVLVARVALVLALAAGSYALVENPIRRQKVRLSNPRVWVPGALAACLALAVIVIVGNVPPPSATTLEFKAAGDAVRSAPVRVMVIGELPTSTLTSSGRFGYSAKSLAAISYGFFGCGFIHGEIFVGSGRYLSGRDCAALPAALGQVVPAYSPTIVALVVGEQEIFDRSIGGVVVPLGSPRWRAAFDQSLAKSVSIAESAGARVVLVQSACPGAWAIASPLASQAAESSRYVRVRTALHRYAAAHDLEVWNLDSLLCPGGQPLRRSGGHVVSSRKDGLTPYGSVLTWGWIADRARASSGLGDR